METSDVILRGPHNKVTIARMHFSDFYFYFLRRVIHFKYDM